jgi:hypothetical protein
MGLLERAHIVVGAGFEKDFDRLASAIDTELQQLADSAETRQYEVVTRLPSEDEGELYTRKILVDKDEQIEGGEKDAKYILVKFEDGWYYGPALTKVDTG